MTRSIWQVYEKYSATLIVMGMQSKTAMRYQLTQVRMVVVKNCWWLCGEKGKLVYCWWDCKLVQLLWKIVWRFLKKLKIELPRDPAIQLRDIYPILISWFSSQFTSQTVGISTLKTDACVQVTSVWRRLLKVPWTRIWNQSILREINSEYSDRLTLKLKLQYFGHLMQTAESGKVSDSGKDWGQKEKR